MNTELTTGACVWACILCVMLLGARWITWAVQRSNINEGAQTRTDSSLVYLGKLLGVSLAVGLVIFAGVSLQEYAPYNPGRLPNLRLIDATHVAVATATHTNLQPLPPEETVSLFVKAFLLGPANIIIGALGLAVWLAVLNALNRRPLGPALKNLGLGILILLPMQVLLAAIYCSQGVPMNVEQGPMALFGAGSIVTGAGTGWLSSSFAMGMQSPNILTDIAGLAFLVGVPLAFVWATGQLLGRQKLFAGLALGVALLLAAFGSAASTGAAAHGGSSFWPQSRALWLCATSGSGNGSLNEYIENFAPAARLPAYLSMLSGLPLPPAPGIGVGALMIYYMSSLYLAALMVGRSPVFMGFKIKLGQLIPAAGALLGPVVLILVATAILFQTPEALAILRDGGSKGAEALLWMIGSSAQNNGSAYTLALHSPLWMQASCVLMAIGRAITLSGLVLWAGQVAHERTTPAAMEAVAEESSSVMMFWLVTMLVGAALSVLPLILLVPVLAVFGQ